jgi:hypothetical protein
MPAGRPPLYETPEQMEGIIESYFESVSWTDDNGITHCQPTMSGLAIELGMDRRSLVNYSHKEEFFPTIKKARSRVEKALEDHLYSGQVAGVIFNLKNNFDWKDKTETAHTGPDGGPVETKTLVVNGVSPEK